MCIRDRLDAVAKELQEGKTIEELTEKLKYYSYYREEMCIRDRWYNLRADMKEQPDPYLHPATHQPVGPADMLPIFCDDPVSYTHLYIRARGVTWPVSQKS